MAQRAPHRISTRDRHPMRQTQIERPPTNRKFVMGILVACLALLVLGPRIKPVAQVLSPIYVPVDRVVSVATSDVGAFLGSFLKAPGLAARNRQLTKEIARLTSANAKIPLYRREIRALNSALGFSDLNPHLDLVRGILIGQSPPGLASSITVDLGTNDGIRVNDPVLDQNGYVIGKVIQAAPTAVTVGLLTDYGINVPAMDAQTGALGLVQYHDGGMFLTDVEAGRRMRPGDFVVTSAIGEEFPVGLLVGQILSVQGGAAQSLNSATLRTAAHLNGIDYVQIVRGFGPGASARYGHGYRYP